jgi:hypothetical protein
MTVILRKSYNEFIDLLAYVIGAAPGFHPEDGTTFERVFSRVEGYIDSISRLEKRELSQKALALCSKEMDSARECFLNGNDRMGRLRAQAAYQYLNGAAKEQLADVGFLFEGEPEGPKS